MDEILVCVLPVPLGDGIRFYSCPGLARIDLEPLSSTRPGTSSARCADGVAVVLTTHFMEEAERLSDRVVIIDRAGLSPQFDC